MCGLNEGDENTSHVIFQAMEPLLTSEYVHASTADCLGTLLVPFQPLLGGSRRSWSCTLGWNPGVHPRNEGLASVTRGGNGGVVGENRFTVEELFILWSFTTPQKIASANYHWLHLQGPSLSVLLAYRVVGLGMSIWKFTSKCACSGSGDMVGNFSHPQDLLTQASM